MTPGYHLTARPWRPLAIPRAAYLEAVEGICRHEAKLQDARGAIIDPYLRREHQYSTPYFAFAVAVLANEGRAADLVERGMLAMDHATMCVAAGSEGIPDRHGEFFVAPLTGAFGLFARHAAPPRRAQWEQRLKTPLTRILEGEQLRLNNWRTYAMKGEWLRARASLADARIAREFVERNWIESQRERVVSDALNLYQDHSSDPESHAVEAVGRGNLLAMIAEGYDGKSAAEIRACVERATAVSLLAQDPSGQCPPNGRTDGHVFNDVLYQLAFEVMAARSGDPWTAGQYRRAAMLAFRSIARWRRPDGAYFITKNRFDPALRVGYQPASNYTNYNGAVAMHLAEAALARRSEIAERPAPCEIGGYAFAADPRFGSAFANAGGMQMMANLRGDVKGTYGIDWTALGVVRFARTGWDSRLGPSDGFRDRATGRGVSFAPTWMEGGRWVRLAEVPERYQGAFHVLFAHPLLVRCAIDYAPVAGGAGPVFRHEFVITPDGVLATLQTPAAVQYAVTWPLLENDGERLETSITADVATTRYAGGGDEQCYIALASRPGLTADEDPVRSTWGWLRPVRSRSNIVTFVYPRSAADPPAGAVRASFRQTPQGFVSVLGRVAGNLYVGRTSAGGEGKGLDIDGDGRPEIAFSAVCGFVAQLEKGRVMAIEADREVRAVVEGRRLALAPFVPQAVG